jgi:hypothetical protein
MVSTKIVLLAIFFFCIELSARTYSISGLITEFGTEENVIGATVLIASDSLGQKIVKGNYTNKFGFYSLNNLSSGKYWLIVRYVGFTPFKKEFTIDTNNLKLNVQLTPLNKTAQEIIVTGEKLVGETKNISTITFSPQMVEKLHMFLGEKDLFRTLQLLPGVKQASELSSGLYIRGGSADQNLYILDGVTVYNPSHMGGLFSAFNSDALRDVKLIKGAFPAEYGGRLSSVIDMTMKEGSQDSIRGGGTIGLISSRFNIEGPIDNNSTFMFSGRRFYFDLIFDLVAPTEEQFPYYFYDYNAKVNYKLGENDRIFASGYFGRDVISVEDQFVNSNVSWGNSTFNLRWMHILNEELFSNLSVIYTRYNFNTEIKDDGFNFGTKSKVEDYTIKGDLQYYGIDEHNIKTGFELTKHNFTSLAGFGFENIDIPSSNLNEAYEMALFIQDEWKITDRISTNMGLRSFYFSAGNIFRLEPRISALYKLSDESSITSAFSYVNQYLHLVVRNDLTLPTDLWFPSTNTIKPEYSLQYVLGFEHLLFDKRYLLNIEAYYKSMNNLLEYKDNVPLTFGQVLDDAFAIGTGRAYGLELYLQKKYGSLTGWIGYTLAWTDRLFPDLNNGKRFPPRYDRRHDISIVATFDLSDSWQIGASWIYGTGQAFTVPTGTYQSGEFGFTRFLYTERNAYRMASVHRLDVNLTNKFTWFGLPWEWHINVYNAYNSRNPFGYSVQYNQEANRRDLYQNNLFPILPTMSLSFKF